MTRKNKIDRDDYLMQIYELTEAYEELYAVFIYNGCDAVYTENNSGNNIKKYNSRITITPKLYMKLRDNVKESVQTSPCFLGLEEAKLHLDDLYKEGKRLFLNLYKTDTVLDKEVDYEIRNTFPDAKEYDPYGRKQIAMIKENGQSLRDALHKK